MSRPTIVYWYFESIGEASAVAGERGDTFIVMNKTAGAQSMVTIPSAWQTR